jgi:hypothetical protein
MSVKTSNRRAAGPTSGNIRVNNDANAKAKIQAPVAKEGLYVRGYTASGKY